MWDDLGMELGLKRAELDLIKEQATSKDCMKAVLLAWLRGRGKAPNWKTLCTALRDELVGRPDIADAIERKLTS